jgi:hypothetical protein
MVAKRPQEDCRRTTIRVLPVTSAADGSTREIYALVRSPDDNNAPPEIYCNRVGMAPCGRLFLPSSLDFRQDFIDDDVFLGSLAQGGVQAVQQVGHAFVFSAD